MLVAQTTLAIFSLLILSVHIQKYSTLDHSACPELFGRKYVMCDEEEKCIGEDQVCDGRKDCEGASDESFSLCNTTNKCDGFLCEDWAGGKCIPSDKVCNDWGDCPGRIDEQNCKYTSCPYYQPFLCKDGSECVGEHLLCDGYPSCADESDEKNCPGSECPPDVEPFHCANGWKCIDAKLKCDGIIHCQDKSDELVENCPGVEDPCTGFRCDLTVLGGKCITKEKVCDHRKDCRNGRDEEDCHYTTCPDNNRYMDTPDSILCHDQKKCITNSYLCDGKEQCEDGSDEWYCQSNDRECGSGEFACADGSRCIILSHYLCNDKTDCKDGSDEKFCTNNNTIPMMEKPKVTTPPPAATTETSATTETPKDKDPCEELFGYDDKFGGSCYRADFWASAKYHTVKESCEYEGAHLLSIDSEEEYQYVLSLIPKFEKDSIWTSGRRDSKDPSIFFWDDGNNNKKGTPMLIEHWADGEPNGGGQDKVALVKSGDTWLYADRSGENYYYPFCEYEWDTSKKVAERPLTATELSRKQWVEHEKHHYRVYEWAVTFKKASEICESQNSHLVYVRNEEENNYLKTWLYIPAQAYWIGAQRDPENNKRWEWLNGKRVKYSKWRRGEPNNANNNEDSAAAGTDGQWNDVPWTNANAFICESDNGKVKTGCSSDPCLNGATCLEEGNSDSGYSCSCAPGFSGNICQMANTDWFEYGGHKYAFMTQKGRTWEDAFSVCVSMGGYMVALETKAEADAVENYIQTHPYPDLSWWIGGKRNKQGEFVWPKASQNTPLTYKDYEQFEPNNADDIENYLELKKKKYAHNLVWNDSRGEKMLPFICEKETAS